MRTILLILLMVLSVNSFINNIRNSGNVNRYATSTIVETTSTITPTITNDNDKPYFLSYNYVTRSSTNPALAPIVILHGLLGIPSSLIIIVIDYYHH